MAVSRERLEAMLRGQESLDAVSLFRCLVPYLEDHLPSIESTLMERGTRPYQLESVGSGPWGSSRVAEARDKLLAIDEDPAFDEEVAQLVVTLDAALADIPASVLEASGDGLAPDGQRYFVRRRDSCIAAVLEPGLPREAEQSHSLSAYARATVLVPADPVGGVRLRPQRLETAHPSLASRLLAERDIFTVLCRPLQRVGYAGLDTGDANTFVHLRDVDDENALRDDVMSAVEAAAEAQATVLVLPELAVPPTIADDVRARLRTHGHYGYPLFTVLGLCHRAADDDTDRDVNEALVLGPAGDEIHRHRKLTCYSDAAAGGRGEQLVYGDELAILESRLGNVTVLICLDHFNHASKEAVRRSHATLLVVPSLSPTTTAHATAADEYVRSQNASSFVCNRWLDDTVHGPAASFWRVPTRPPTRLGEAEHELWFRLAELT